MGVDCINHPFPPWVASKVADDGTRQVEDADEYLKRKTGYLV
jgi:hypothetical protein